MKKDVKMNLLDHSVAKVQLLREYLQRYLGIISNLGYNEKINIYDLFCGEGLYENGGKGSPLVIMDTIADLVASGVVRKEMPPINCHFNDIKKEKVEKLDTIIRNEARYGKHYGDLMFTVKDYQDEVKELAKKFKQLRNEKAFVFIDPYGYADIHPADVKELLLSKKAEVLLFLPIQFMYRFEEKGTPQALIDILDELVGYKNWKPNDSVWSFIEHLKEAFRSYLPEYFVDTFTIQKDANTVFCLFFFSAHIRGFEKMLEAKWKLDDEEGKGWEYTGQQNSLFIDFKTNSPEELLKTFLQEERSNSEIYELTLHAGFLPKHTNEILRDWQNKGMLQVTGKEKVKKGAFYITYKCYAEEPHKVKIKRL
jgi:three-Cys-motif partner protein